jgi:hypothetical protein
MREGQQAFDGPSISSPFVSVLNQSLGEVVKVSRVDLRGRRMATAMKLNISWTVAFLQRRAELIAITHLVR